MPKKKTRESQKTQSKRFDAEVQKRIDAGDLSPTDAAEKFDEAVRAVASPKKKPN